MTFAFSIRNFPTATVALGSSTPGTTPVLGTPAVDSTVDTTVDTGAGSTSLWHTVLAHLRHELVITASIASVLIGVLALTLLAAPWGVAGASAPGSPVVVISTPDVASAEAGVAVAAVYGTAVAEQQQLDARAALFTAVAQQAAEALGSQRAGASGGATNTGRPAPAAADGSVWDRLAQCESSGDWSINTGNGFTGGLQFVRSTWLGMGGAEYAPDAYLATREQQIDIATRVLASQGWGAWPGCSSMLGLR